MRSGTRSIRTIVMKNDRILMAEGKEFFAFEDGLVYWYDKNVEVKMIIPISYVKYAYREDFKDICDPD